MQTTVTYSRKFRDIRKSRLTSGKTKFGEFSFKSFKASKRCMMLTFYTETSSQLMCSSIEMAPPNWVTWMLARLLRRVSCTPKQAPPITLPQKCGKISLTMASLTFGLWVASFTSQFLWSLHSEQMIWLVSTKKWSKEFSPKYLHILAKSSTKQSSNYWWFSRSYALVVNKS